MDTWMFFLVTCTLRRLRQSFTDETNSIHGMLLLTFIFPNLLFCCSYLTKAA